VAGDGDTTAADLVGEYTQNPDGTFTFIYGPLVRAMQEGKVLFLDDATLISPAVLAVAYPAMDGRREITVKAHKGEVIKAADGFYVVAGHNPGVHGAILTEALSSRFSVQVRVSDAARRSSPMVLIEVPHLVDLEFIAVRYWVSRIVSACRGGSLTLAAAGGTSQATSATGLRQCGQAGSAARPSPVPAGGGDGRATPVVAAGARATLPVAFLRLRRRGFPWARCQRCLQRALQYFCRGAAGVQVNGVPHWGQSRCSALTGLSRRRWRPCG
jgi:AAA domain (dynein-related subfamily)